MGRVIIRDKPSIYIDTMIARDVTHRRNDNSEKLIRQIENGGWACYISTFGIMELIDIEQEELYVRNKLIEFETLDNIISTRKQRSLIRKDFDRCSDYIDNFVKRYPFIQIVPLDDTNWNFAMFVASDSNLQATDVIHLISALQCDCDVIVTRDEFFIKEARRYIKEDEQFWGKLKICRPESCCDMLRQMGYNNIP